jgi:hypothetical protein
MSETAKASSASTSTSVTTLPHHRRSAKDDMNDAAELKQYEILIDQGHHAKYRPLFNALSLVQDAIHQPFTRCDKQALYQQKW